MSDAEKDWHERAFSKNLTTVAFFTNRIFKNLLHSLRTFYKLQITYKFIVWIFVWRMKFKKLYYKENTVKNDLFFGWLQWRENFNIRFEHVIN
jgi:hypothetical protein